MGVHTLMEAIVFQERHIVNNVPLFKVIRDTGKDCTSDISIPSPIRPHAKHSMLSKLSRSAFVMLIFGGPRLTIHDFAGYLHRWKIWPLTGRDRICAARWWALPEA